MDGNMGLESDEEEEDDYDPYGEIDLNKKTPP